MVRLAWQELRLHPSRYIATLIAIAISIGFLAAASIVTATEQNAIGRQDTVGVAGADLVMTVSLPASSNGAPSDSFSTNIVGAALAKVPGVAVAARQLSTSDALTASANLGTSANVTLAGLPPQTLRASTLVAGAWPTGDAQIALAKPVADALGVTVGGKVSGAFSSTTFTVTGLTNDTMSMAGGTAWIELSAFGGYDPATPGSALGDWAVKLAPGADPAAVSSALKHALATPLTASVLTVDAYRADQANHLTGGFDVWQNLLTAFAGIALVVGLLTIANTFTILLAQRRRTTGLLRAIGASGAQVRASIVVEAVVVGLVGSILGVGLAIGLAAVAGLVTGSLAWGIVVPAAGTLVAVGVGIVVTVVAAVVPSIQATRVSPLEALQPMAQGVGRGAGVARGVVCGLLALAGVASVWAALSRPLGTGLTLGLAAAGCVLVAVGILFGARLFVPGVFRGVAGILGRCGTTARLAAKNIVRNPRRTTATATALMLAVGLIVTLQATMASLRESIIDVVAGSMPVDLYVSAGDAPVPDSVVHALSGMDNIGATASLSGMRATTNGTENGVVVLGWDPSIAGVVRGAPATIPDGEVFVNPANFGIAVKPGQTLTLTGEHGATEKFTIVSSRIPDWTQALVSPAALAKLGPVTPDVVVMASVSDHSQAATTAAAVSRVTSGASVNGIGVHADGYLLSAAQVDTTLTIVTGIATALLGVAVLIALIGVSNTLTLSVIERTRESALMRALGLQRAGLRLMLLVEALVLAGVGLVIGLVAGSAFGWIGILATVKEFNASSSGHAMHPAFTMDPGWTVGLVAVVFVAAALASVLPGRRAATATPVEALADL